MFKANLHIDPNDPISNYICSLCLAKNGKIDLAEKLKEKALKTNGCSQFFQLNEEEFIKAIENMVK